MVTHIKDKDDLESKLNDAGSQLVVIDFFATWCGPCRVIAPKLEELANEYTNILILKVDVDECEELAMEYNISSMPTFVFIKNKTVIQTFSGANYDKLKATILDNK
ncbi:thioredoxin-2 [Cylas formicarius]|uniref:thioredoxin-2 n=1 Tax=Cylas formicarius TaxID=197179 RepID=UPI0029585062|nr:thioredoxin-2 [Cylas formicarius]